MANSFAVFEHLVTKYLFGFSYKDYHPLMIPAFVITVASLILRILAFYTAKSNFTHKVAYRKKKEHQLVTNGIYSIFRHPSYTGFFYFSVGSMVMIGNFISAAAFWVALSTFF